VKLRKHDKEVDSQIPTELNWEQFLSNKVIVESYPRRQVPIEVLPAMVWDQTRLFICSLGQ